MTLPHVMLTPRAILLSLAVGASTGAFIALVADRILRRGKPALLIDAVLGAIGYLSGALAMAMLPFVRHTTSYSAGGMIVRTVSYQYQDAYRLAFGVAAIFAGLYELIRHLLRERVKTRATGTP